MRSTALCLPLLFATATLSAQGLFAQSKTGESPALAAPPQKAMSAPAKLGQSPIVLFASANSGGCPIGIVAERHSAPIVNTIGSAPARPQTQGLELRFSRLLTPEIAAVTLTVHGLSGRGQFMPAGTISSDASETFQLTRAEQAKGLTDSYLQPKRVRTAQWIELTSVDFTDGTTWHATHGEQCTVTPSNLVLVSAR